METQAITTQDEQIVGLELAGECYGVEIGRIQEIIRMQPITAVPNGAAFFEGLTNLRGRVIPVMDLRKRFGLPTDESTRRARIVVVELRAHTLGLIVDGVSEVLHVTGDQIEPPSILVTTSDSSYLRGVARLDERLILLVDLEHLLANDEVSALAA